MLVIYNFISRDVIISSLIIYSNWQWQFLAHQRCPREIRKMGFMNCDIQWPQFSILWLPIICKTLWIEYCVSFLVQRKKINHFAVPCMQRWVHVIVLFLNLFIFSFSIKCCSVHCGWIHCIFMQIIKEITDQSTSNIK